MRRLSLFLDLDGTLLELAEHPDAVSVPTQLPAVLQRLDAKLEGALAMATGRNINVLDGFLFPYRGSAIGVHGTEHRLHGGAIVQNVVVPLPTALRHAIADIVRSHPGAFVEDKGSAVAVHERGDTVAAAVLAEELQALCARLAPGWQCLHGRRVVEIKPKSVGKGTGTEWLMQQPPFAGTLPVAVGDDFTDLDMFKTTTRFDGLTVAVGDRITEGGNVHLRSPAAVLRFLEVWSTSESVDDLAGVRALARQAGRP